MWLYAGVAWPSVCSRQGGRVLLIRSVSVCPFSRSRVTFVMAKMVLCPLRAVSNSCVMVCSGVSPVPAVSDPYSKMMLFCA